MLDENLPTFHYRASSENPLSSVLYFTQNGSDPAPEYVFRRADPTTNPASRSKYAAALTDPYNSDVVYAEVVVEPEWQQPTLSGAEVRAQNGIAATPVPIVPDTFTIQLYDPDQRIPVKMIPGSWNKTETWEFEMPQQSFKLPSASRIDRENSDDVVRDITPKIMFKWKKDGRLSKDMTCYMVGKSLGKHKSKEPDITVALFKQARESALTIYEPNLQRVEVEDRKGLDIVLTLSAEVIKGLFLAPRPDVFNLAGAAGGAVAAGRRKNTRPTGAPSPPPVMSGAAGPAGAGNIAPTAPTPPQRSQASPPAASITQIDAETRRLQAIFEKEQREREKRDREEQRRIRKMLETEEKEQKRREAEVARETERLRKKYGIEGQELPSRPTPPALPQRPAPGHQVTFAPPPPGPYLGPPGGQPGWYGPLPPARPVSAGPAQGPFHGTAISSWWAGPGGGGSQPLPPRQPPGHNKKRSGSGNPYENPAASASGWFGRSEEEKRRVQKKRSVHF